MVQSKVAGSIIHLSSVGAYAAQEFSSLYCAAKSGLVSLAQSMALDLARHGIRVNGVRQGTFVPNRIRMSLRNCESQARQVNIFGNSIGRPGTPEEIGHVVAFFAPRMPHS